MTMRDEELPAGFRDGDFEMRDLEAAGRRAARARKRGQCDHGWRQGYPGHPVKGEAKCLHCGVVDTVVNLDAAYREIHG